MQPPLTREWHNVTRSDCYTIVPLGDVHLGNAETDEAQYKRVIQRIADDPTCFWVGMGDYLEAIKLSDPRFDAASLAPWIGVADLGDLVACQRDRFMELTAPIADRCLGMVEGNHEISVKRWYEQDIYRDIVTRTKTAGGFPPEHRLAFGAFGWLRLVWYMSAEREHTSVLTIYVHHGFTGGKLAGAKALDMQRWLWTHAADIVLFGHGHGSGVQVEAIEECNARGAPRIVKRIGVHCGSFLTQASYAVAKGHLPLSTGYCEIHVQPHNKLVTERVRVLAGF